jgi:hypothetical protein
MNTTPKGSKHSAAVALIVRAGTSPSPPISSLMDETEHWGVPGTMR